MKKKNSKTPRKADKKNKKMSVKAQGKARAVKSSEKKKEIPIGRTIKTKDKYLPYDVKKVKELKDKRWVVVVDKNSNEELAVVRLTDEKQPNTTELPTYKKGNRRTTYFKHFVEIADSQGNAIRVDGKKFLENADMFDLSKTEMNIIRDKVFNHVKQAKENRNKILVLKTKSPRD